MVEDSLAVGFSFKPISIVLCSILPQLVALSVLDVNLVVLLYLAGINRTIG
jgi:hypothetical protein